MLFFVENGICALWKLLRMDVRSKVKKRDLQHIQSHLWRYFKVAILSFSLFLTELNGTWRRTRGYCIHVLHTPFNDIAVYFWLKLEKWKRTISCMPRKKIFQFSGRKKQMRYNLVWKFVWCTHFLILFAKSR